MKHPFRKSSDSAAIEAELQRLAGRKAEAERKRSEVLQALEEARQARRDVLDGEQASIDGATAKLKALTIQAGDLAEMIEDFDAAIDAASERFRQAREHEARQAAAEKLDTVAAKVEGLTGELEKSVKQLVKTARAMLAAIPGDMGIFPLHESSRPNYRDERGNFASGREAVAAVLADALAAELPELFDAFQKDGYRRSLVCLMEPLAPQPDYRAGSPTAPLPARDAVDAIIVGRLKARAQAIRSGEQSASLADIRFRSVEPARPKSVDLIAVVDVGLMVQNGIYLPTRKMISAGRTDSFLPDHAAKLIKTGAFLRVGTPEADAFILKFETDRDNRKSIAGPTKMTWSDVRDLGDPLGLLEAEKEEAARID